MQKSPSDHRHYQAFTLNNGLRVLCVHDPKADKAAAAMAVNAGHFNDPDNCAGLAHFLEHMLFLGTEKYPGADTYSGAIAQHGGNHNAWTGTEHTSFFFDSTPDFFPNALDMFAQFFVCPSFAPEFVDRERQAIDAEFKLKLKDDTRRIYDIHKATVNPAHPFSKFSVGNQDTLGKWDSGDLRRELLKFYDTHYHAGKMTLSVISPHPLEQLSDMVTRSFDGVAQAKPEQEPDYPSLYRAEDLQLKLDIKPHKALHKVIVSFALPGVDADYRRKPLAYLSALLGHEGPGSLISLLKKKHYAIALSAGGGVNGSNFKDFNIAVQLTEEGEQNLDFIVSQVLAFIDLIRRQGINEWRYEEKRKLLDMAFTYQEKGKPLDLVSQLCLNMQHYPADDYIYGDYAMDGIEEQEVKDYLAMMTPQNMRLIQISPDLSTDRISPWYKADYARTPIDDSQIALWLSQETDSSLALPQKNSFICERDTPLPLPENPADLPVKLHEQPGLRLWHKQDIQFRVPKGHIYLAFDLPNSVGSIERIAMTRLFIDLFLDQVTEDFYAAEMAGLNYHLYPHQGGMSLHVSGLSDKQTILIAQLIDKLMACEIGQARFDLIKHQLVRVWQNSKKNKSISQLFNRLNSELQPNNPAISDLADTLEEIDFNAFDAHCKGLFEQAHLDCLMYGDWDKSHATRLKHTIEDSIFRHAKPCDEVERPLISIKGEATQKIGLNIQEHDPAIVIYYQADEQDIRSIALFSLYNHLLSPAFFHELRTNQQLGYIVGTGYLTMNKRPGMALYIQSPKVDALELQDCIDSFVEEFNEALAEIPMEHWQRQLEGLISQWLEKDTSLRLKSQRLWVSVGTGDFNFDKHIQVANALKELTPAELCDFANAKLRTSSDADRLIIYAYKDDKNQQLSNDKIDKDHQSLRTNVS